MSYTIVYLAEVVKNHIPKLSEPARKYIKKTIEERLTTDPIAYGKPLRYSLKGHRRIRVGDYRIVYRINDNIVTVIAIAHRKDIYKN